MIKRSFLLLLTFGSLLGCTEAYQERTTPENCACGDWYVPTANETNVA